MDRLHFTTSLPEKRSFKKLPDFAPVTKYIYRLLDIKPAFTTSTPAFATSTPALTHLIHIRLCRIVYLQVIF